MSRPTITINTFPDVLRPIEKHEQIQIFDDLATRLTKVEGMFDWLRKFSTAHPDIGAEKKADIARRFAHYKELRAGAASPHFFFPRIGARKQAEQLFRALIHLRAHFWARATEQELALERIQLVEDQISEIAVSTFNQSRSMIPEVLTTSPKRGTTAAGNVDRLQFSRDPTIQWNVETYSTLAELDCVADPVEGEDFDPAVDNSSDTDPVLAVTGTQDAEHVAPHQHVGPSLVDSESQGSTSAGASVRRLREFLARPTATPTAVFNRFRFSNFLERLDL